MAEHKVVFADNIFPDLELEQGILGQVGAEVVLAGCKSGEELAEAARDADALAAYGFNPIGETLMARLNDCKLIVRGGIGVDTIDVRAATKHGIIVTNIPSYCVEEVATHTMSIPAAAAWSRKATRSSADAAASIPWACPSSRRGSTPP